jgi:signal peptidase I
LRWTLGLVLIICAGWGLLALEYYITESTRVGLPIAAALSLALFYLLEKNMWLSRTMGLRVSPRSSRLGSALSFWLLGVASLLFRSTQAERGNSPEGQQTPDSTREVFETVVFVVVLVLLLKSFAAEAFVIPTGSMADTLYGYQKQVTCEKCGYEFPVNFSSVVDPQDGRPQVVESATCPNCRWKNVLDLRDQAAQASTGDRVLVGKFLSGLVDRWNTVVFKYPVEPQKFFTATNYIKRLIGKGDETIGIHRGKLYVLSPEAAAQYGVSYHDDGDPLDRWKSKHTAGYSGVDFTHENDSASVKLLREGKGFHILRKPPKVLLALMRPVYLTDYPAKDLELPRFARWAGPDSDTAWKALEGHAFRIDATGKDTIDWLRYRNVLRDDDGKPSLITDFMDYNSGTSLWQGKQNWVGDLILETEVKIERAEGVLVLELSKGPDRFQAQFDLSTGICSLIRLTEGKAPETLASKQTSVKSGTFHLRFANVDDRLVVWVDNRLVEFPGSLPEGGVAYEPGKEQGLIKENDLDRPASIGVKGGEVTVRRLNLFRDTYYTIDPSHSDGNLPKEDWKRPDTWSSLRDDLSRDSAYKTIYVQPGHYLCLGDNSPESSDGRCWGLVPERLMLGRALTVYYPLDRFGLIK